MSKIVNEYGVLNRDIDDHYKEELLELDTALRNIIKNMDLNGEEIRQLYDNITGVLDCYCSDQIITWGTKHRKKLRETKL